MNDDFLTRYRKSPPRGFSEALYKRINMDKRKPFRWLMFASALGMALLAALVVSPAARAAFNGLIVKIGGMTFTETEPESTPLPESQVTTVPSELLPLTEALAKLPYAISLPAWIPEGFLMNNSARIMYFPNNTEAIITWTSSNPEAALIELMVLEQPVTWEVDTESVSQVDVNGQPAAVVDGGWDADSGQWNSGANLSLSWVKGDQMYLLRAPGGNVEDLIRIAESIP